MAIASYSQDIKVKKGELFLNNNSVGKIEKVDKKYQLSDLSGNVMFSAIITNRTIKDNETDEKWLELIGANNVVREVELSKKLSFTFSNEKFNIDAVLKSGENLLTENGFDKSTIEAFFTEQKTPFSDKWDAIYDKEKELIQQEDEYVSASEVVIDSKGNIFKKDKKIGSISFSTSKENSPGSLLMTKYVVRDVNGSQVAVSEFNSIPYTYYEVITFDQNKIEILAKTSPKKNSEDINKDPLAKRIVYRLYKLGYHLGDMTEVYKQYAEGKRAEAQQKVEDAKKQTKNVYDQKGYVIDHKGNKLEGVITIEFESLNEKLGKEKGVSDLTSYGNSVEVKVDDKRKYFKAKDGVKVYLEDGRQFLGAPSMEDGFFGHGGSQLNVFSGASQFFEVLFEKENNYVLVHVKYPEDYYLKLKNNDKAVYLGDKATFTTKSDEKIKSIFDKYVNCPSLNYSKYNTKSKESMIQIVQDYVNSCK